MPNVIDSSRFPTTTALLACWRCPAGLSLRFAAHALAHALRATGVPVIEDVLASVAAERAEMAGGR